MVIGVLGVGIELRLAMGSSVIEAVAKTLKLNCKQYCLQVNLMAQVQLRLPDEMIAEIDSWVKKGKFKSRSDAIKTIISLYEEREKTRTFYQLLSKRSEEAKKNPQALVPLQDA